MKFRSLLPIAGAAVAALSLHGCADSFTTGLPPHRPPAWPRQTSPENVLENLQRSIQDRDIAHFDSLLYDAEAAGDTVEGFMFRFWDHDNGDSNVPATTSGRDETISYVAGVFDSPEVEDIDLKLTYSPPYYDNTQGHEGQQIVYATFNLSVVTRREGEPEPTTHRFDSQFARFRFKVQWVEAMTDSIWRIIYVECLETDSPP
jgi:hypothetical protein